MDEAQAPGAGVEGRERRRQRRVSVAGVAVVEGGGQPPCVWRVANLSLGGASLVGDNTLPAGALSLGLHVAGFPVVELSAKILRRQLVTRAGKSAVKFIDVPEAQREILRQILAADHTPAEVSRRALIIEREGARLTALAAELSSLGFKIRKETSAEQAAAWLQRETTEILLVGESIVEADRWGLLQFVRDTAPEVRRFVLASDVRKFRLYYAMKAGLVDGLVEPKLTGDALARRLLGASGAAPRASDQARPARTPVRARARTRTRARKAG
jgi:PleD family two-component response regulator